MIRIIFPMKMNPNFPTSLQDSIHQSYALNVKTATPIGTNAMSTTMVLSTNRGRLFLKRYRESGDQNLFDAMPVQQIAFTHEVQCYLLRNGIPMPRLIPNKAESTYTASPAGIYAISEFIEGEVYKTVATGIELQSAGEMLGRIHQSLRHFQPSVEFHWEPMIMGILSRLKSRLSRIRSQAQQNETNPLSLNQIDRWSEELEMFASQLSEDDALREQARWVIHGDYRAQNLVFDQDYRVQAIVDFDMARPASRLFELSYALIFFPAVYQDVPLTASQQSIFLRAYESICPLSETDHRLLNSHLKLAFLRGMTLWLYLYYFAGMRHKIAPWIDGYMREADRIMAWEDIV